MASEKNNKLVLKLEYCTNLFKKETIFNMLNHYINILISVLDNEKIILKNIDMISCKEKQCILNKLNQTKFKYAKEKSIHELIINQARLTPNSIALVSGS